MSSLQEQQAPIDRFIVESLIAATPESWNAAEMRVERHAEPGNQERLRIEITSPQGHRDVVAATDDIYDGLFRLSDVFAAFGQNWSAVHYLIDQDKDGSWKFRVEFEY